MTRSRLVVFSSMLVVAAGALAAVGVLVLSPARAAVGPLPAEALILPAEATFVGGLDVKRFTASPFYKKYARLHSAARPQTFAELEEKTGLNPERDLDRVIVAGTGGQAEKGVVLVSGTFDRYKLGRHLETEGRTVTTKKDHGTEVYLFREGTKGAGALAFLDDHTLVLGSQAVVEATLASQVDGRKPLRANAGLMELLAKVKPGSTFWVVGDQSLLAQMPKTLPAPGAEGGATLQLPALKSLTVTGELDPIVALEVTGSAADEAAAKNLADVVRGFAALFALQANQKPELKAFASAISVTSEANQVHVNARFPYELLDALQTKKPAAEGPKAEPPTVR